MAQFLFDKDPLTAEHVGNATTFSDIASEMYTTESVLLYQASELESEDTIEHIGNVALESLTKLKASLKDSESVDKQTFEAYTDQLTTALSMLSGAPQALPDTLSGESFSADSAQAIAQLETTTEGVLQDIKRATGRLSRQFTRMTSNLLTTLTTRQKTLVTAAKKLTAKMSKYTEGEVSGVTVKNSKASTWFESPKNCVDTLKTFSVLRGACPAVQANLADLGSTLSPEGTDFGQVQKILTKSLDTFAKAPGMKVSSINGKDAKYNYIEMPSKGGLSRVYAVAFASTLIDANIVGRTLAAISAGGLSVAVIAGAGAGAAVAYGTKKLVGWAMAERMPVLKWGEISDVLTEVTTMANTPMSLRGLSGSLAKIEKAGTQLLKGSDKSKGENKRAYKGMLKSLALHQKVISDIYSYSGSASSAGVAYATSSLKAHIKAQPTQENVVEGTEDFLKDLDLLETTFESIHALEVHAEQDPE